MTVIALLVGRSQSFASLQLYWEGILLVHPTTKNQVYFKESTINSYAWYFQVIPSKFSCVTWYVQNVSTFPNTFDVVSPLICVFWIQLTWTNAIFNRIDLVSCFCAEIQLSRKIPKNTAKILFYQKTNEARIRDGEGPWGAHTPWWRGPALATPGGSEAASAITSTPPSTYIYPLTWKHRGFDVFPR
jgi:hypothetical protein